MTPAFIAADFGGGSGRIIAGTISNDGKLILDEVHRFPNRRVTLGGTTYWDFPALYADMLDGLRKAAARCRIISMAIDTWGVDFGLIDQLGNLVSNPVSYRDASTVGMADEYFRTNSAQAHYSEAGIQVMDINTMFRLMEFRRSRPEILEAAAKLLFMPDLFGFFLCGAISADYCIASTSELLDARTRQWNTPLIQSLGLRPELFPPVIMPGTVKGILQKDVADEIGVDYQINVVAAGSHDTACAVFAAMNGLKEPEATAFLSSGTWSLLGCLSNTPILTEQARLCGFTNEGAVGGKIRLLQNITGLWILQELMAQWEQQGHKISWNDLTAMARESTCSTIIDVDHPSFASTRRMDQAITSFCHEHLLPPPVSIGDYARCVMASLAQRYASGIESLNSLLPTPVKQIRIIGGGSQNSLLNQLTAQATGLKVISGPVEATAIGSILLQAQTAGIDISTISY